MIGQSAVELNKYQGSDRPSKHAALDIYRNAWDGGMHQAVHAKMRFYTFCHTGFLNAGRKRK